MLTRQQSDWPNKYIVPTLFSVYNAPFLTKMNAMINMGRYTRDSSTVVFNIFNPPENRGVIPKGR